MQLELVLSFFGASLLLALMPGPDNIYVLTESLINGHRKGIAISLGLSLGVLIHTLAAATGLSLVIQNSALAFSIIKYLGAAYLFYLAYQAYGEQKMELDLEGQKDNAPIALFLLVRKGFLMNVLNPKVSLFFIAFLPQFVSESGMNVTFQMIILGLIFMIQAFVVFSLLAMLASRLTKYIQSPKFWTITKWSKIVVLSVLGLALALATK